jgi:signal transduction histidine kinase
MSIRQFKTAVLFSLSILTLSAAQYAVFDRFLITTGQEIVKAWYFGEVVNLQEGQILSAIAKNQNLIEQSPFIKAVVVVDKNELDRSLFSVGELSNPVSPDIMRGAQESTQVLANFSNGFLDHIITARLPGHNGLFIVYEITSALLFKSYLLVVALGILFVGYLMGITLRISNNERRKRESLRTDLLARLSHDLDSPLLTISNISLEIKKLDRKIHFRLEQAAQSIRSLLLQTSKTDKKLLKDFSTATSAIDEECQLVPFVAVLKEFMTIKRGEMSELSGINLNFEVSEGCEELFVKINLNDFKRHLSNIIKNAVEATEGCSERNIFVGVSSHQGDLTLSITDSGSGIAKDKIPLIGKKGISLKGGKGLGLHFAIESVRHWQGRFNFESELGVGTKISISLPTVPSPRWFISKLTVDPGKKIILVDDDKSMMARWRSHLEFDGSQVAEFNTAEQFRNWFHGDGQFEDDLKFVFDFHLDGSNTGLGLIDELGIAKESTLVTSAYLDEQILSEAERLKVQVLPKVLV